MRKFIVLPVICCISLLFVMGTAMAYPWIEVEGYVSSLAGTTWTYNGDGTVTIEDVTYTFVVTTADAGAEMDSLSLEFEDEVFTDVDDIQLTNPTDWSISTVTSSSGSVYVILDAGTTLEVGEVLEFTVDVTLYVDALINAGLWQEGQVWGQSWAAGDTLGGYDGGSTTPTPEPTTMLLLGTGLLGLAGFSRKKLFQK